MGATPETALAIGDYGVVADGRTCALVGRDGSVGWLCLPRFDSGAVVAALLDDAGRGGEVRWAPRGGGRGRQQYVENTNVLTTEWNTGGGGEGVRITDWMPTRYGHGDHDGGGGGESKDDGLGAGALCRRAEALEGDAELELWCAPRGEYGLERLRWTRETPSRWRTTVGGTALWAVASFPLEAAEGGLRGRVTVRGGEAVWFVLAWGSAPAAVDGERMRASLENTAAWWRRWAGQARYDGPYREAVVRSALALKALIYAPTGAIVAAATSSLPEAIGGGRNWDYRYCWPRDATFALYGLSLLGYHAEAGRFLEFVGGLCRAHPAPLQVCYRVDGGTEVDERELAHLSGYRGSRPVRIGNAAAGQLQLDSAGEVLDAAYTYAKWRNGLEAELWDALRGLADYTVAHWREPDESIWEVRGGPRPFVFSKVLCWVALDRALRLAYRYQLPGPVAQWTQARGEIREAVLRHGYNRDLHAFVQAFPDNWAGTGPARGGGHAPDTAVLDSSLLLMPLLRFCSPHDPRMESTIRRVQQALGSNGLLGRYQNTADDGVGGGEGAFAICTFWMVDCLALLGKAAEAKALFERMLGHAGPLGLFSEELDVATGALLGNYPQAFTHMAVINSAHNLQLYPSGVA